MSRDWWRKLPAHLRDKLYDWFRRTGQSIVLRKIEAAPAACPKCGGPVRDLRGVGFNTQAIEAEGICFLWSNAFTCLRKKAAP